MAGINVHVLVVFVGFCIAAGVGHVCLLSPPQRGSITGLNKPGATDCVLLSGPCGGRQPRKPTVFIQGGDNFTVVFQKNLDHYNATTPGYFSLSGAPSDSKPFYEVARVADRGEPSLHLYTINVTAPIYDLDSMITVQLRYVTNNVNAPPTFYQCSDVEIYPPKYRAKQQ